MNTVKKYARVIDVEPTHLLLKDAMKFVGMEFDLFKRAAKESGLSEYRKGPRKIWYKKTELEAMIESYKI